MSARPTRNQAIRRAMSRLRDEGLGIGRIEVAMLVAEERRHRRYRPESCEGASCPADVAAYALFMGHLRQIQDAALAGTLDLASYLDANAAALTAARTWYRASRRTGRYGSTDTLAIAAILAECDEWVTSEGFDYPTQVYIKDVKTKRGTK